MSRNQDLLLQFVRLLKHEQIELRATHMALGEFPECQVKIADRKKSKDPDARKQITAALRRLEDALLDGRNYQQAAEEFLKRQHDLIGDF